MLVNCLKAINRYLSALLIFFVSALSQADCSQQSPELFDDFYARFSTEKPFAIDRTRLPLAVLKWTSSLDIDGRKITEPFKYPLSLSEYWRWPTLGEYIANNSLQARRNKVSDSQIHIDLFKEGFPQTVTYRFETNEGCWFLTQYQAKAI